MVLKTKDYIFIFIVIAGLLIFGYQKIFGPNDNEMDKKKIIRVGSSSVVVDVVSEQEEMRKGLGGREMMKANEGMLFVHGAPGQRQYSMRDMMFNLDFIFILDDTVVDIAKNVSYLYKGKIAGATKYNYVLEVNAGWTRNNDVKIGTKVEID